MSDLRDAARQALEAMGEIEWSNNSQWQSDRARGAITALRAALEQPERAQAMRDAGYTRRPTLREMSALKQPEQEPVAWLESPYGSIRMNTTMRFQFPPQSLKWKIPLYLHPPRREWRGLSEEEISDIFEAEPRYHYPPIGATDREFARAIEAALKERNA